MYKNVQVNHYNNASSSTTPFSSSSFPSQPNQNVTSLPVQITSGLSSSSQIHSNIGDSGISLSVANKSSNPTMSSSSKIKTDVDQLDDLVKDLL